jgi:hypothetical protein
MVDIAWNLTGLMKDLDFFYQDFYVISTNFLRHVCLYAIQFPASALDHEIVMVTQVLPGTKRPPKTDFSSSDDDKEDYKVGLNKCFSKKSRTRRSPQKILLQSPKSLLISPLMTIQNQLQKDRHTIQTAQANSTASKNTEDNNKKGQVDYTSPDQSPQKPRLTQDGTGVSS